MKRLIAVATVLFVAPALAPAQDIDQTADHQYHGQGYGIYGIGAVASALSGYSPLVQQVGFGGEGFIFKGLGLGGELAYVHWGAYDRQAWLPSVDLSYHVLGNRERARVDPFGLAGVSVYVPTMHGNRGDAATNFGGGINLWFNKHAALRFEFRNTINGGVYDFGPGNPYFSFRFGIAFR